MQTATAERPHRTRPERLPHAWAGTCVRAGCREPAAKCGLCQRHWAADMRELLGAMDEARG